MPRLSKIGAACLAAFGFSAGSSGPAPVTASYLIVAGGGGGGGGLSGGGGGGGGLLTGSTTLNPLSTYTIIVGSGGARGAGGNGSGDYGGAGGNGNNSSFTGLTTAIGGGGGAGWDGGLATSGGSGGGASYLANSGASGTAGQGNRGGNSLNNSPYQGAGGGGAGAQGGDQTGAATQGGVGASSSISGLSVTYAGGGSGGGISSASAGGGGYNGGSGSYSSGGGGGGNGSGTYGMGGAGGSGVIIVAYSGSQKFGGGVVSFDGTNTSHTFTTSGQLVPLNSLSASYLIVAGGGGGTSGAGGGGGAGGLLNGSSINIDTSSTYVVTVGSGGASNNIGTNSSFSLVSTTALGGGSNGSNGGSGYGIRGTPAGSGQAGQGYAGGTSAYTSGAGVASAGGGGGAGSAGLNGASNSGGNGGSGVVSSISGAATYYAAGGGGGIYMADAGGGSGGQGGSGIGGYGGINYVGGNGAANTGSGGGGGGLTNASGSFAGGNGGSGIFVLCYPGSTQQMAGGTVTIVGGNVIHTFTSSGYLTPLTYVGNSLRFRGSAGAYLNRTQNTATNGYTWTWSAWVKRGSLGSSHGLFGASLSGVSEGIQFVSSDALEIYNFNGSAYVWQINTSQLFRDPAAWYHIVVSVDGAQATASNRVKVYVNGTQVTAFSTASYPAQNTQYQINQNTAVANIGKYPAGASGYLDGYIAEQRFIDGQALAATAFGSFNAYGVWQPINYGGSYGTNGFYLPFSNKTSTAALGYDFSPAGNNWTTNNISLTAGSTYDSTTDVPTLTSTTAANYAVMNPLDGGYSFANANLYWYNSVPSWKSTRATIAVSSGKFYWEVVCSNTVSGSTYAMIGIDNFSINPTSTYPGATATSYGYYSDTGIKFNNAASSAYGAGYVNGDVIGVAFDATAGTLTFYKNNVSQGVAFTGISGTFTPTFGSYGNQLSVNFGQTPFAYTPPTGFVALNTYNL